MSSNNVKTFAMWCDGWCNVMWWLIWYEAMQSNNVTESRDEDQKKNEKPKKRNEEKKLNGNENGGIWCLLCNVCTISTKVTNNTCQMISGEFVEKRTFRIVHGKRKYTAIIQSEGQHPQHSQHSQHPEWIISPTTYYTYHVFHLRTSTHTHTHALLWM